MTGTASNAHDDGCEGGDPAASNTQRAVASAAEPGLSARRTASNAYRANPRRCYWSLPSAPASRDTPTLTVAHWSGREPSALYFSADAGNVVTDLGWKAWGRTLAFGEGESVIQSCVPSCAQGADMPVRAYVVLSLPRHGRFTHLTE